MLYDDENKKNELGYGFDYTDNAATYNGFNEDEQDFGEVDPLLDSSVEPIDSFENDDDLLDDTTEEDYSSDSSSAYIPGQLEESDLETEGESNALATDELISIYAKDRAPEEENPQGLTTDELISIYAKDRAPEEENPQGLTTDELISIYAKDRLGASEQQKQEEEDPELEDPDKVEGYEDPMKGNLRARDNAYKMSRMSKFSDSSLEDLIEANIQHEQKSRNRRYYEKLFLENENAAKNAQTEEEWKAAMTNTANLRQALDEDNRIIASGMPSGEIYTFDVDRRENKYTTFDSCVQEAASRMEAAFAVTNFFDKQQDNASVALVKGSQFAALFDDNGDLTGEGLAAAQDIARLIGASGDEGLASIFGSDAEELESFNAEDNKEKAEEIVAALAGAYNSSDLAKQAYDKVQGNEDWQTLKNLSFDEAVNARAYGIANRRRKANFFEEWLTGVADETATNYNPLLKDYNWRKDLLRGLEDLAPEKLGGKSDEELAAERAKIDRSIMQTFVDGLTFNENGDLVLSTESQKKLSQMGLSSFSEEANADERLYVEDMSWLGWSAKGSIILDSNLIDQQCTNYGMTREEFLNSFRISMGRRLTPNEEFSQGGTLARDRMDIDENGYTKRVFDFNFNASDAQLFNQANIEAGREYIRSRGGSEEDIKAFEEQRAEILDKGARDREFQKYSEDSQGFNDWFKKVQNEHADWSLNEQKDYALSYWGENRGTYDATVQWLKETGATVAGGTSLLLGAAFEGALQSINMGVMGVGAGLQEVFDAMGFADASNFGKDIKDFAVSAYDTVDKYNFVTSNLRDWGRSATEYGSQFDAQNGKFFTMTKNLAVFASDIALGGFAGKAAKAGAMMAIRKAAAKAAMDTTKFSIRGAAGNLVAGKGRKLLEKTFAKVPKSEAFKTEIQKSAKLLGISEAEATERVTKYLASLNPNEVIKEFSKRQAGKAASAVPDSNLTQVFADMAVQDVFFKALPRTAEQLAYSRGVTAYFVGKAGADYIDGFQQKKEEEAIELYCMTAGIKREEYEKKVDEETREDIARKARARSAFSCYLGAAAASAVSGFVNFKLPDTLPVIGKALGSSVEKRLASGAGSFSVAASDAAARRMYGGFGQTVGDMLEALTSSGLSRGASILVAARIMGTTLANTFRTGLAEAVGEVADGATSYFITAIGQNDKLDMAEMFNSAIEGGILGFVGGGIAHNVNSLLPRPKITATERSAQFGRSRNIFLNKQWEKINKAGQAGQDVITRRTLDVRRQIKDLENQVKNGVNAEANRKEITRLKAVAAELSELHWSDVTQMKIARLFDGDDAVAQKLIDLQKAGRAAGLRYVAMTAQAEIEDRNEGLKKWLKNHADDPAAALYEAQYNALNLENTELQRELGVFDDVPQTLDEVIATKERMQELVMRDAVRRDELEGKGSLTEDEQRELDQIKLLQLSASKYAEYLESKQAFLKQVEDALRKQAEDRIDIEVGNANEANRKTTELGDRLDEKQKEIDKHNEALDNARQRRDEALSELADMKAELELTTDETITNELQNRISAKETELNDIYKQVSQSEEELDTLVEEHNKLIAERQTAARTAAMLSQKADASVRSNYQYALKHDDIVKEAKEIRDKAVKELKAARGRSRKKNLTDAEKTEIDKAYKAAQESWEKAKAWLEYVQKNFVKNSDDGLLTDIAQVETYISRRAEEVDGMTLETSNPYNVGTQAHSLYNLIVQDLVQQAKASSKGRGRGGVQVKAMVKRLLESSSIEANEGSVQAVEDFIARPILDALKDAGVLEYRDKSKSVVTIKPSAIVQPVIPASAAQINAPESIPAKPITGKPEQQSKPSVDAHTPMGNSTNIPKTTPAKPAEPTEDAGDTETPTAEIPVEEETEPQPPHVAYTTTMRETLMNRSPRFGDETAVAYNQLFDKVASLLITENGIASVNAQEVADFIDSMNVSAEEKAALSSEETMNEIAYALNLVKDGDSYKFQLTSETREAFAKAIEELHNKYGNVFNPVENFSTMQAFTQSVDDAQTNAGALLMSELKALGMATDGTFTSLSDAGFLEAMNKLYGNSQSMTVFNSMCDWLNAAGVLGDVSIRPIINDSMTREGVKGVTYQNGLRNGHHQYVIEVNVGKDFNTAGHILEQLVHEVGHAFFSEVAFKNDKISSALADVAIESRAQIFENQQAILAQFRTQFWMMPDAMKDKAMRDLNNMLYGVGLRLEAHPLTNLDGTPITNPDGSQAIGFEFLENGSWQPQEFYTVAISNRMMNWAMSIVGSRADAAIQDLTDLVSGRQFLGLIMGSYIYGENRDEDERMWNATLALIDQLAELERSGKPVDTSSLEAVARAINAGIKDSMMLEERAVVEDADGLGENNIDYGSSYGAMFNRTREYASALKRKFNAESGNDLSLASFNAMARNAGYDTRTAERDINVDTVLKENNGVLEASNGTIVDLRGDNPTAMFNIAARHASPTSGIRKMSLDFLGSGSGAQAYGYGLYFTTNKEVHEVYVKDLGQRAYQIADSRKESVRFDEKAKRLVGDKYNDGEYEYIHLKKYDINIPLKLIKPSKFTFFTEPESFDRSQHVDYLLNAFHALGKDTIAALSGEPFVFDGKLTTVDELKNEKKAEIDSLKESLERLSLSASEKRKAFADAFFTEGGSDSLSEKQKEADRADEEYNNVRRRSQQASDVIAALSLSNSDKADAALLLAMNPKLIEKSPGYAFLDLSEAENVKETQRTAQLEVEINADDSDLLIWKKPLTEQNEKVQRAMSEYVKENRDNEPGLDDDWTYHPETFDGEYFYRLLLVTSFGPAGASRWLKERGIPGIKYKQDFGQAGPGDNLVIFDKNDVQITRYSDAESDFQWTEYYDETANFPREGIRPMYNRMYPQHNSTSDTPLTLSHPVFDNLTGRRMLKEMEPPYDQVDIGGETYHYQRLTPEPAFNLIGSRAKTWGKYFAEGRRPFRSQDGRMKMEIDTDSCVWKTEIIDNEGNAHRYESPWQRLPILGQYLAWGNFMPAGKIFKVGDVIDYPELFESYPHLKNMNLKRSYFLGCNGMYDPDLKLLLFDSSLSLDQARSVLLHELQHAVQDYEGFAAGGDQRSSWKFIIDTMKGDIVKTDIPLEERRRLSDEERAQKLSWMQKDWEKSGDWRAVIRDQIIETRRKLLSSGRDSGSAIYMRLLGEVEARTVQKRRNYTVEQRKEIPFESDYDVALNEVILTFDTRYDWLAYFARVKREEKLYARHVENVKQEVRHLLDTGRPKTANIVWKRLIAENERRKERKIYDEKQKDVVLKNDVMFNIAGPKAKGYNTSTDGVFEAGDGTLRRELDSSQAKVKDIYVSPSVYTQKYVDDHIAKAIKASKVKEGLDLPKMYRDLYRRYNEVRLEMDGMLVSEERRQELQTQKDELLQKLIELSHDEDGKLSPVSKVALRLANDELAASGYNRNQMLWKNKEVLDGFADAVLDGTVDSYQRAITRLFGRFRPQGVFTKKLSDVLEYPALYEAYPELKDLEVRIGNNYTDSGKGAYSTTKKGLYSGWYDSEENFIQMNPIAMYGASGPLQAKLTLVHEVQHWIQHHEGWTVTENLGSLIDEDFRQYLMAPEEAESRTTEVRSIMSPEERSNETWLETYNKVMDLASEEVEYPETYIEAAREDTGESQVGFVDEDLGSPMYNRTQAAPMYNRTDYRKQGPEFARKKHEDLVELVNATADYSKVYPIDDDITPERLFEAIFLGDFLNRQGQVVTQIPNHKIYQATISSGFNKTRFTPEDVTDNFVFALASALSDAKSQGRKVPEEFLDMFNSLKNETELEEFKQMIRSFITDPLGDEATGSMAGAAILGGFSRLVGLNAGLEVAGIDRMEMTVPRVFMYLNNHMIATQKLFGGKIKTMFGKTLAQRQREAGVYARDFHLWSKKILPASLRRTLGLNWRGTESDEELTVEYKNLDRAQRLKVSLGASKAPIFNAAFDRFLKGARTEKQRQQLAELVGKALGSNEALYDYEVFKKIERARQAEQRNNQNAHDVAVRDQRRGTSKLLARLEEERKALEQQLKDAPTEEEKARIQHDLEEKIKEYNSWEAAGQYQLELLDADLKRKNNYATIKEFESKNKNRQAIITRIQQEQKKARETLRRMATTDGKAAEMLEAINQAREQIDKDMRARSRNNQEFADAVRGAEGIYVPRLFLSRVKGLSEAKTRFFAVRDAAESGVLYDLHKRVEQQAAEYFATKTTEGFYQEWTTRLSEAQALTDFMSELRSNLDKAKTEEERNALEVPLKQLEARLESTKGFMSNDFKIAKLLTKDENAFNYYRSLAPYMAYKGEGRETVTGDTFDAAWGKSFVYRLITQSELTQEEKALASQIQQAEQDKSWLPLTADTIYKSAVDVINRLGNKQRTRVIDDFKKNALTNLKNKGMVKLLDDWGLGNAMARIREAYKIENGGESITDGELIQETVKQILALSKDGTLRNATGNPRIDDWIVQSYSLGDSYKVLPATKALYSTLDTEKQETYDSIRQNIAIDSFIAKLEDHAMSRGFVDRIDRVELKEKIKKEIFDVDVYKDSLWNYIESLFFEGGGVDVETRHDLPAAYMQLLGAQLLNNAENIKDAVQAGISAGLRESTKIDFYEQVIGIFRNMQDSGYSFNHKPTKEEAASFGRDASDYVNIADSRSGWVPTGVQPITSELYVLNTAVEDAKRVYDAFQNNTEESSTVEDSETAQLFGREVRKMVRTCNALPLISGITPTLRNFMGMVPMVVVPTGANVARLTSSAYTAMNISSLFLNAMTAKTQRNQFLDRLATYRELGVVETDALYSIRSTDWSTLEEFAVREKLSGLKRGWEIIGKAQLVMGKIYSLPDSFGKIIAYEANFADLCTYKTWKAEYQKAVELAKADGITENMITSNHALLKNYMSEETFDTINKTAVERMSYEQPSSITTPDWVHGNIPIYKDDTNAARAWKKSVNAYMQVNGPFTMFHYNMLRSVIKNFQYGINDLQAGLKNGDLFGQAWSGVNRIASGAALLVQPLTKVMVPGNIAQSVFSQVVLSILNSAVDDDENKWKLVDRDNSTLIIDMINAGVLEDYWDTQDGIVLYRVNEEGTKQFTTVMTDFVNPFASYTSTARHLFQAYKTGDWRGVSTAARSLLGPLLDHHLFFQRILNADKYVERRDVALPAGFASTDIATDLKGILGGIVFDDPKIFLDKDVRVSQTAAQYASIFGFMSPDLVKRIARIASSTSKGTDAQMASWLGAAGFGSIYPKDTVQRLVTRFVKMEQAYNEGFFWDEYRAKRGELSSEGQKKLEEARAIRETKRRMFIQLARDLDVESEFLRGVKQRSGKLKPAGVTKATVRQLREIQTQTASQEN